MYFSQINLPVLRNIFLTDFTDFTDFRGGVERVIKQVIISLSEAVLRGGQGHHTGRFAPSVWC